MDDISLQSVLYILQMAAPETLQNDSNPSSGLPESHSELFLNLLVRLLVRSGLLKSEEPHPRVEMILQEVLRATMQPVRV